MSVQEGDTVTILRTFGTSGEHTVLVVVDGSMAGLRDRATGRHDWVPVSLLRAVA